MNPHYSNVANRATHRCEYCHAPESVFNFPFEVEHIIPTCLHGSDVESNWALACRSCNLHKSTRLECTDPESGQNVPLFNPRNDRWPEHFRIDPETAQVLGTSAVGRATVMCLNINSPNQLLARREWMRIGAFP